MKLNFYIRIIIRTTLLLFILQSCKTSAKKRLPDNFIYQSFKDSIKAGIKDSGYEVTNLFDSTGFNPQSDTLDSLLNHLDSLWHRDIVIMQQIDTLMKVWKKTTVYTPEEMEMIKENIKALDSFRVNRNAEEHEGCTGKECLVYAEVDKSKQLLYLYLDEELMDSFPVSTGIKSRETPAMSVRPSGPLFMKYTSRKFPGGNYLGLGNMPYAVFIRGGYAIHGTTPGNFRFLGNRASHGCIRLHPVNAKIFYELIKRIGLAYTWVTVQE